MCSCHSVEDWQSNQVCFARPLPFRAQKLNELYRLIHPDAPASSFPLEAGAFNHPSLPLEFLDSFVANATLMVRYVKRLFPKAAIGWRTVVPGAYNKENGTMIHRILGRKSYLHQLNAAGRLVVAIEGLFLVDLEAMVAGFHDNSHLLDLHHQSVAVSLETANLYLHLLQQLPLRPKTFADVEA